MGQDLIRIENTYNTIAKKWAEVFAGEHDNKPMDQQIIRKFVMDIGDRAPVWEFGCGPGNTAQYLTDLGLEISGLDLSEKMLEQARTLHPDIHFQKGNILELEFENQSIAGVIAFYAIVHFTQEQVETAFREIFRVLRPDGLFLFTYHIGNESIHTEEFNGQKIDIDFMFFTTDFIVRCLKKIGFENIEVIEREPYPKVEYQSRRAYVFTTKQVI